MIEFRNPQHVITVTSLVAVVFMFFVAPLGVNKLGITPAQRRRAKKAIRYVTLILTLALLSVVWADELKEGALLVSAFAVAIVLANKEVIMCITGWWLKLSGSHFRVGDRIQVGDYKGDVVDYGLLTTTLMEVDTDPRSEQRSGSVIILPNSIYFAEPVRNETKAFSAHWHTVTVVVREGLDWKQAEQALLDCGQSEWSRLKEEIHKQEQDLEENFALKQKEGKPRIFVSQRDDGRLQLELRIALPVRDARSVEDRIMRAYFDRVA